jgi:endonuclease YncB( thermonuclease family)
MATVVPYRRLRNGSPRRLPTPQVLRVRPSPFARIGHNLKFIALVGALVFAAVFVIQSDFLDRRATTIERFTSGMGAPTALAGYPFVIDGDTLRLNGKRIRILGIDAPERSQTCRDANGNDWACGKAASQRLFELISGGPVECTAEGHDRYGRTLATCSAQGVSDLGAMMVREGYAVNYGGYWIAEASARLRRNGLWAGDFERPQDWRRRYQR